MTKKKVADDTEAYRQKVCVFNEAIYREEALKGLVRPEDLDGYNDLEDRYWSAIFYLIMPDPTRNKETRLRYGFGGPIASIIFLYDHATGKSLLIKGDFDKSGKFYHDNICHFARFEESRRMLVAQFNEKLILYQINPETLQIVKTINSANSEEDCDTCFRSTAIANVVFDKNGLDYFAMIDGNGKVGLVKYDLETLSVVIDGLFGYMTRFGLLHCLFVKQLAECPLVVLGVSSTMSKSEPDMGYTLFVQNNGPKKSFNLWQAKNEFFDSATPNKFVFGELGEDGYIQIDIYHDDILLTKTIVPTSK
jgi:hypothetical protein